MLGHHSLRRDRKACSLRRPPTGEDPERPELFARSVGEFVLGLVVHEQPLANPRGSRRSHCRVDDECDLRLLAMTWSVRKSTGTQSSSTCAACPMGNPVAERAELAIGFAGRSADARNERGGVLQRLRDFGQMALCLPLDLASDLPRGLPALDVQRHRVRVGQTSPPLLIKELGERPSLAPEEGLVV